MIVTKEKLPYQKMKNHDRLTFLFDFCILLPLSRTFVVLFKGQRFIKTGGVCLIKQATVF